MNEVLLRLGPEGSPSSTDLPSSAPTTAGTATPLRGSHRKAQASGKTLILDVDADQSGPLAWLELAGASLSIVTPRGRFALPANWSRLEQPKIRSLGAHGFLVIDSLPLQPINAWVFDAQGRLLQALEASGGLDAVGFAAGGFAIGFHPGGAEANGYPSSPLAETAGVAFFEANGELAFGLNDRLRAHRLEAHNVLAMAKFGPSQLIFIPESLWQGERVRDCPLVIYDWARDSVDWWVSPFLDPLAVAGNGLAAYVFSPIGFDDEVMAVDLKTLATRSAGVCADIHRGLDRALFLAQINESTFSVVHPSAPAPAVTPAPVDSSHGFTAESGSASVFKTGEKSGDKRGRKNRARLEIVR